MIPICFRLDDPSPVSDHELERKIFAIFQRHKVPLCVAAVPFRVGPDGCLVALTTDSASHLVEASRTGVIEIAQHGYSHSRLGDDHAGAPSEFAGVPRDEQARMVRSGQQLLSGLFQKPVRGFVPPWNSYDATTAQELAAAGFDFMSAGWEVLRDSQLAIVPRTCGLADAQAALQEALLFHSASPVVVIVFHPDDFEETTLPPMPGDSPPFYDLKKLDALLAWITAKSEFRAVPLSELAREVSRGASLWHVGELKWLRYVPFRLQKHLPRKILMRAGKHKLVKGAVLAAVSDPSQPPAGTASA